MASQTTPDTPSLEKGAAQSKPRFSRKAIIIAGSVLAFIIVGLAVGLGVGLTVGRQNNNNNNDSDSTPTTNSSIASPAGLNSTTSNALWLPPVAAAWQIVLLKPLQIDQDATTTDPNVDIWDIDVYTNNQGQIQQLQNMGKKVICYFSAGTWESFRNDSDKFPEADRGNTLDGYPNEKWLNLRSEAVRDVIRSRIDYSAAQGCNAIDPDNIDAYNNNGGGFDLTEQDSIDFIKFMYEYAGSKNLSMGLKNGGDILPQVLPYVHFSVNEQCVQYSECEKYAPMIQDHKPVFHIEYVQNPDNCLTTGQGVGSDNFSTVFKNHGDNNELDGFVQYCDGKTYTTPLIM